MPQFNFKLIFKLSLVQIHILNEFLVILSFWPFIFEEHILNLTNMV